MSQKDFGLNPPFREIEDSDAEREFKSDFLSSHDITLSSLVEDNKTDGKHVWVYELEGKILAVLSFQDMGSYFYMDIVAINDLFPELCDEVHPGYSLFSLLEDVSPNFGYSTIRLDSTDERVSYWKGHDYELIGMPSSSDKWGQLFPMEKKLN